MKNCWVFFLIVVLLGFGLRALYSGFTWNLPKMQKWSSQPSRIIMIRHGEKNKGPKNGCDPDPDLNSAGLSRVKCLVPYFGLSQSDFSMNLLKPGDLTPQNTQIYAKAVTKCCASTRPIVTISGVAQALGLTLPDLMTQDNSIVSFDILQKGSNPVICSAKTKDSRFNVDYDTTPADMQRLADDIRKNPNNSGKTIVICWEHDNITNLISYLFPAAPTIYYNDLPNPTQGKIEDVFDRTWVFTPQGNTTQFEAFYSFTVDTNGVCKPKPDANGNPSYKTSFVS
jgi:hypothetical protein